MAERSVDETPRSIVRREVLRFAIPGAIGIVLLALASLTVSVAVAREQSVSDARTTAEWLARTVVEPRLDEGLQVGKPARIAELDAAFSASIRGSDVKAIVLWDDDGVILYASDPRLIGERVPTTAQTEGGTVQGTADLTRPENRYLDPEGTWVQVSLPVAGQDGQQYLFQISKLQDSLRQEARSVWLAFAPILAGSMVLLGVLLVVLGVRMASRISAELRTREDLLQRAVDASEMERRRIAADLHDGTVQHLAGLSFALAGMAARAQASGDQTGATVLADASEISRTSVRELRSLLVDIYPPNLEATGLAPAIADLLDDTARSVVVDTDIDEPSDLEPRARGALYRVAREALANVSKHAEASHVSVQLGLSEEGAVFLRIVDDGRGFDVDADRADHLGLRLMDDVVTSIGGRLVVTSSPGAGTSVWAVVER